MSAIENYKTTFKSATGSILKKFMNTFNFLETIADSRTIVAKDGSLVSIIKIDGIRYMMGTEELLDVVNKARVSWSAPFSRRGHAMQVFFSRDPDLSSNLIKDMNITPRIVAKKVGLEFDDIFDEQETFLPKFMVQESLFIALWTRPNILNKQELSKMKIQSKAPEWFPSAINTQDVFKASRTLKVRHDSFVENFMTDLNGMALRGEVLEVHQALKMVKSTIYPDVFIRKWKPFLPGDTSKSPLNPKQNRSPFVKADNSKYGDVSHLLFPRLDEQLFDGEAEVINSHIIKIGNKFFGGVDMTVGPQDLLPFNVLLNRLIDTNEFPWRVSFLIEGDGLTGLSIKKLLASILRFTNKGENGNIQDALNKMESLKNNGQTIVRLRVSFATWAPANTDGIELIEERIGRLQSAVEAWGYCNTSNNAGDPLAGVFSSALGLDIRSTAPTGAAPLDEVVYMLPLMRDASPFDKGSILFRTEDKRIWAFEPGSSEQNTFIDIIFAPPGGGKSVYLGKTSLAFCLSPVATSGIGGSKLPRIAILDIGPSSSGLISLLKEALPANRRHEVEYRRLKMIKEHSINPFDTQLGSRKPLPLERSFLINFITLLATSPGKESADGLPDLVAMIVDEAYNSLSDLEKKSAPRPYSVAEDANVDEALKSRNINVPINSTWWYVVDKLFEAGDIHNAYLAQRYAVPRINDLLGLAADPKITNIHGTAKTQSQENLISAFNRTITSAINAYPILSSTTKFDIGEARVVSLNIEEAAPQGGEVADKQTAVVYMLARFILAKDFYLNPDVINSFPEKYRDYHTIRITRIRETPKKLIFDEFHRTSSSKSVREQVKIDMREGRKWNVQIALASQLLDDFDKDMISLATGFWIFGKGSDDDVKKARDIFGLSNTAYKTMLYKLNGPGRGGAPFLTILKMKDGKHEHYLYNTIGPVELWAFSTTSEDVGLRNRIYKAVGPSEGRKKLAKAFPGGSAKKAIDKRKIELSESGINTQNLGEDIIEDIAKEILKNY
jgi:intracellular multiplication protein IcmB